MRQARSEVTRRKIINSAVDLFSEIGYAAAGLGDIIERAEMTKGALYYHFDSKEALATEIMYEGSAGLAESFAAVGETSGPALESIIHGALMIVERFNTDKAARVAAQLLRAFGKFNDAARQTYIGWVDHLTERVQRASEDGDLRTDIEAAVIAEAIVAAMLGTELLSNAVAGGGDLRQRMVKTWELLLPAIVAPESLEYFREFLARESLRHATPAR
jgi:AcrR family transcriptional regulator